MLRTPESEARRAQRQSDEINSRGRRYNALLITCNLDNEYKKVVERLRGNPNLTYPTLVRIPGSGYNRIIEMTARQQAQLLGIGSQWK